MSAPIQAQFLAQMNAIAEALDEQFNGPRLPGIPCTPTVGFCLLTFEFGRTEGGRVNYISNGERADMIAAMREWLARAEGRIPDLGQVGPQ